MMRESTAQRWPIGGKIIILPLVKSLTTPKPIILSVDDDEGCTFLIRRSLEDAWPGNGFEQFADGQALLDFIYNTGEGRRCENGQTYVVLIDIRMPRLSGIDVLRRLRADLRVNPIPIIMLSTTDDPGEVELCYQLGCSAFIQKPVDYQEFAERIRRIAGFIALLLVPPYKIADRREAVMPLPAGTNPSESHSPASFPLLLAGG